MAKKYLSYHDLCDITGGREYTIPGTMGTHYLKTSHDDDGSIHVSGYASNGKMTGTVTVMKGETLGYDRGRVWMIPDPANVKDPVRRFRLMHKLPKGAVIFVDDLSQVIMKYESIENEFIQDRPGSVMFMNGFNVHYDDDDIVVIEELRFKSPTTQLRKLKKVFVSKQSDMQSAMDMANFIFSKYK
jgi:hypothetical protein